MEEVAEDEEDGEEVVEEEVEGSTAHADICLHACNKYCRYDFILNTLLATNLYYCTYKV